MSVLPGLRGVSYTSHLLLIRCDWSLAYTRTSAKNHRSLGSGFVLKGAMRFAHRRIEGWNMRAAVDVWGSRPTAWAILSHHSRRHDEIPAVSVMSSADMLDCFEPSGRSGRIDPAREMATIRQEMGHVLTDQRHSPLASCACVSPP
jgi:hypothetical protein